MKRLMILLLLLFGCATIPNLSTSFDTIRPEPNFIYNPNGRTEFVVNDITYHPHRKTITTDSYDFCASLDNCDFTDKSFMPYDLKYESKRGYFISDKPLKTDHIRNLELSRIFDYYPVMFEDGKKCIFYVSKGKDIFSGNDIMPYDMWKEKEDFKPEPLFEDSDISITTYYLNRSPYVDDNRLQKRYILSDGTQITDSHLSIIRMFFPKIEDKGHCNKMLEIIKGMDISYDKFEKKYFIIPDDKRPFISSGGDDKSYVRFYIGVKDDSVWLRFKLHYHNTGSYYSTPDWLFLKSFKITTSNSTWDSGTLNVQRDNSSSSIWEWTDFNATDEIINIFREFVADDNSMMRLYGSQYHKDMIVDEIMRKNINDILTLYSTINKF